MPLGQLAGFRLKTPAHAYARKCSRELAAQVVMQPRANLDPYMLSCQIVEENKRAGFKFFNPDTMRCFGSRVMEDAWDGPGGVFFVTSEREPSSRERWYKVRRFEPSTARVASADCPRFATAYQAKTAAAKLSRGLAWNAKAVRR